MGEVISHINDILEAEDSSFSVLLSGIWHQITVYDGAFDDVLKDRLHEKSNETLVGVMELCCQELMKSVNPKDVPTEAEKDLYSRIFLRLYYGLMKEKPDFINALHSVDRGCFIPFLSPAQIMEFYQMGEKFVGLLSEKGFVQRNPENNDELRVNPYINMAVPIGHNATCSAPYMVMTYNIVASLFPHARIFEAGTGCGYHLASTASINPNFTVFSADIVPELCKTSIENIKRLQNAAAMLERIAVEEADCLDPENGFFRENAPYKFIYFTFLFPNGEKYKIKDFIPCLEEGGILMMPLQDHKLQNSGKLIAIEKMENPFVVVYDLGRVLFTNAVEDAG